MKSATTLKLLVGLGNPGAQYALTRHNVGWQVLDLLTKTLQPKAVKTLWQPGNGELLWLTIAERPFLLLKPLTYMNASGDAVAPTLRHFQLSPREMLVVSDDLDMPAGKLRLKAKGSCGGHRGLMSIIQNLQTEDFPRLRIGIGRPQPGSGTSVIDWVLSPWVSAEDSPEIDALRRAAQAIRLLAAKPFEQVVQLVSQGRP